MWADKQLHVFMVCIYCHMLSDLAQKEEGERFVYLHGLPVYKSYMLFLMNFPDGLAWDWVNEKLYWTDNCDDDIEVFDPATGYRRILIETGLSNPTSIVVDPGTRYVSTPNYTMQCGQTLIL